MSRALAPVPESARIEVIRDGYQLCGLCGKVMLTGEIARVVPRAEWYLVYSHEKCLGAVRGWKSVRHAELIHARNVYTPRPAFDGCVCILDNKNIYAELDCVDYQASDERPTRTADIRQILESAEIGSVLKFGGLREDERLTWENVWDESLKGFRPLTREEREEQIRVRGLKWSEANQVEDALAHAVGSGTLAATAIVLRTVLANEQCSLHVTREITDDDPLLPWIRVGSSLKGQKEKPKYRGQGAVHSREENGEPVEYSAYFRLKIAKLGNQYDGPHHGWVDEFQLLQSFRHPKPLRLPWSSRTHPSLYVPVVRDDDSEHELRAYMEMREDYPGTRDSIKGLFDSRRIDAAAAKRELPEAAYSRPVQLWPGIMNLAHAWLRGLKIQRYADSVIANLETQVRESLEVHTR